MTFQQSGWTRGVAVIFGGVLALWLVTGITLDRTLGNRAPVLALMVWPQGSGANVGAVTGLLKVGAPDQLKSAAALAAMRATVLREPVNSDAVANYAALTEGGHDTSTARKFFRLAESLSRRQLLTQTWLIEDAVRRGEVAEAIRHYDRALAVSEALRPQLLPILAKASSDHEIAAQLWPVLAKRPLWGNAFLTELATSGENSEALDVSARALRLDIHTSPELVLAQNVLRRLLELKAYQRAIALAEHLEGRESRQRFLQDGNFDSHEGLLPFGWWMSDGGDVRAFRDTVPTGGTGLRIEVDADAAGGAAQQLIGLAKGQYVFRGIAGDIAVEEGLSPFIDIVCPDGRSIKKYKVLPSVSKGQPFAFAFEVPATNCGVQWINISASSNAVTAFWIARLSIVPIGSR